MSAPPEAALPQKPAHRLPRLSVLVGVTLVIGIFLSARSSLTTDEAFTLHTTGRTLRHAWDEARSFEMQPPLYFLLMTLWRKLARGLEFMRLFSTLCVCLSLIQFRRLSQLLRIGGGWWDLALLAALTPRVLWAAAEARVYALALLLVSSMLVAAAQLWFVRSEPAWRPALLFILTAYGALMTQYYSGFVIAGIFSGCLLLRDRRGWWVWAALTLLLLPWLPVILAQVHEHPTGTNTARTGTLWLNLLEVLFRWSPLVQRHSGRIVLVLLAGALLWQLVRQRRPDAADRRLLLIGMLPALLLAALRLSGAALVEPRHWIPAVPGLLLLWGLGLTRIADPSRRQRTAVAVFLFWGVALADFVRGYEKPEWKAVASAIRTRPGTQPVVLRRMDGLALRYYLGPDHALFGDDPSEGPPPDWAAHRIAPLDSLAVERIAPVIAASGGLWVVNWTRVPANTVTRDLKHWGIGQVSLADSVTLKRFRLLYYEYDAPVGCDSVHQ